MSENKQLKLLVSIREYEFLRYQAVIHNCSPASYLKKLIVQDMKQKHGSENNKSLT